MFNAILYIRYIVPFTVYADDKTHTSERSTQIVLFTQRNLFNPALLSQKHRLVLILYAIIYYIAIICDLKSECIHSLKNTD